MAQTNLPQSSVSLPEHLIDTYKQYKNDTGFVSTWLGIVGDKCGYNLYSNDQATPKPPVPTPGSAKSVPRLKGKARKLAKDAEQKEKILAQERANSEIASKTLTLRDFVPLAKHIATSKPPVVVPGSFLKKLERAISLRRRCLSWFKFGVAETVQLASNQSHEYFVQILEIVLQILKPLGQKAPASKECADKISSAGKQEVDRDSLNNLENRFEALTVEAAEEEEEEIDVLVRSKFQGDPGTPSSTQRTKFVTEQESSKHEFMLASFCFFDDLRGVRSFLQDIWQKYKQKQVTLITASLVTNMAFEFIQLAEQVLTTSFGQTGDYYDCFIDQIFRQACAAQGHPFLVKRDGVPLDTKIYVDEMADEAHLIMLPVWHLLNYGTKFLDDGGAEVEDMLCGLLQIDNPPERLWQLHRTLGHSNQPTFDSMLLILNLRACSAYASSVDVYKTGLEEFKRTKSAPAWLVFAAQNYLDVQHILQAETMRGVRDVESTCSIISCRVQQHIGALGLLDPLDQWSDEEGRDRRILVEDSPRFLSGDLDHSKAVYSFYPLGAGLKEFLAVGWFQRTGLRSPNGRDVVTMAHLYHALRLETRCAPWPDMEFLIQTQTPEYIFLGGKPTSFDQCRKKAELAMGCSIRTPDLKSNPDRKILFSDRSVRELYVDATPFANLFSEHKSESLSRANERRLETLDLVLNAAVHGVNPSKFKRYADATLIHRAELFKAMSKNPKATLCERLGLLANKLEQETPVLYFDFYGLRITCARLLKAINQHIDAVWSRATGMPPPSEEWTSVPAFMVALRIFTIATYSKVAEETSGLGGSGSRVLNEVQGIVDEFTQKDGNFGVHELGQFASGAVLNHYQSRLRESPPVRLAPTVLPTLSPTTDEEVRVISA